jgi:thymidylate kinase
MAEHEESSRLITAVFHAWQAAGINFLVLRNYENLPHFTTNDIDVLVARPQFKAAEKILIETAQAKGFRLHNRAEFATLAFYFSHIETNAQIHFDLFSALKWRGFEFISSEDFLAKKIPRDSFFILHPAHEAVTNLLASFIFNGQVKEKYRTGIVAGFRADPEIARTLLAKTYGQALAVQLVQFAAQENWSAIESRLNSVRRTLIFRQWTCQPLKTFLSLDADCDRLLKRVFYPPGLVVVLCGPDGCGKSTVAPKLIEMLRGTFSLQKNRQIHWKPRIFSKSREGRTPVTNPHGKPARNILASLLYFKFHWLEFFFGWWLRILPVTFRGGLVLIDRFYYDFFVDQKRYRLRVPKFLVRLGYALLPKPNLVFLLDASPEILQQRKQEVPLEETTRQRAAYVQLVSGLKNGKVINANQSADKVASDIQKAVLDFMVERTAKRNG